MRCLSCNTVLTDYEATMKDDKGRYLDFCLGCYSHISKDVRAVGNPHAYHYQDEVDSEGLDDPQEL